MDLVHGTIGLGRVLGFCGTTVTTRKYQWEGAALAGIQVPFEVLGHLVGMAYPSTIIL